MGPASARPWSARQPSIPSNRALSTGSRNGLLYPTSRPARPVPASNHPEGPRSRCSTHPASRTLGCWCPVKGGQKVWLKPLEPSAKLAAYKLQSLATSGPKWAATRLPVLPVSVIAGPGVRPGVGSEPIYRGASHLDLRRTSLSWPSRSPGPSTDRSPAPPGVKALPGSDPFRGVAASRL